ncbi:helix-turn-helix domain-containing protein [Saccharothrix sp. HUAS TT1]|uniref:helix-turn-helix domain-containing protein n=1 Tax=unclassified Saccharothrix TaxID=2593673 RepID=UPI00345C3D09
MYQTVTEVRIGDLIDLLAHKAPMSEFERMIDQARLGGAPDDELAGLEAAARQCLRIAAQAEGSRRREAGLDALVDAARELAVPYDLDTLLQVTTRRARHLLGMDMAYIALLDEEHGYVRVHAADGHTSSFSVGARLPAANGLGVLGQSGAGPYWTSDFLADDRVEHNEAFDELVRAEGLHALVAAPLNYGARLHCSVPSGVLYAASRHVRHFTADERSLLASLGTLAGMFIEHTRLRTEAEERAKELEVRLDRSRAREAEAREVGEVRDRMVDLVLAGANLHDLVVEARGCLGAAVAVCSVDGRVLAAAGSLPGEPDPLAVAAALDAGGDEPVPLGDGLWVAPVRAGARCVGSVLVPSGSGPDAGGRQVLRAVARSVALLLREDVANGPRAQLHECLLEDMLAARHQAPRQLDERARRAGVDLDRSHVLLVARPEGGVSGRVDAWTSAYALRAGGLRNSRGDHVVLLVPGEAPGETAKRVSAELTEAAGSPVSVGAAGPLSGAAAVHDGYQEAVRCVDAITALGAIGGAASTRELGFVGVLLSDDHDVAGFIDAAVGPLLDYDQERYTDLVPTLEAYFEEGGSPTYAAGRLHVHTNTVTRRLDRIKELLGPEWQKPERALDLQLALRLLRVRGSLLGPGADGGASAGAR